MAVVFVGGFIAVLGIMGVLLFICSVSLLDVTEITVNDFLVFLGLSVATLNLLGVLAWLFNQSWLTPLGAHIRTDLADNWVLGLIVAIVASFDLTVGYVPHYQQTPRERKACYTCAMLLPIVFSLTGWGLILDLTRST